jgi:glutamine amidotransferase
MGWNTILSGTNAPLLEGIDEEARFYFVHSYAGPVNAFTVASCDHGTPFAAVVQRGNFCGVHFHPERSGVAGARLLKNFVEGRV